MSKEIIEDVSEIDKILENPKYFDKNNIVKFIYVSSFSLKNRDELYKKFENKCTKEIVDYTLNKLIDKEMLFEEDGKISYKKK